MQFWSNCNSTDQEMKWLEAEKAWLWIWDPKLMITRLVCDKWSFTQWMNYLLDRIGFYTLDVTHGIGFQTYWICNPKLDFWRPEQLSKYALIYKNWITRRNKLRGRSFKKAAQLANHRCNILFSKLFIIILYVRQLFASRSQWHYLMLHWFRPSDDHQNATYLVESTNLVWHEA